VENDCEMPGGGGDERGGASGDRRGCGDDRASGDERIGIGIDGDGESCFGLSIFVLGVGEALGTGVDLTLAFEILALLSNDLSFSYDSLERRPRK